MLEKLLQRLLLLEMLLLRDWVISCIIRRLATYPCAFAFCFLITSANRYGSLSDDPLQLVFVLIFGVSPLVLALKTKTGSTSAEANAPRMTSVSGSFIPAKRRCFQSLSTFFDATSSSIQLRMPLSTSATAIRGGSLGFRLALTTRIRCAIL